MATDVASHLDERTRSSARERLVLALGPTTTLAGIVWAAVHPWRMTIFHPHGQGFWWLFTEPPLWLAAVGVVFALFVAPGLLGDLRRQEEGAR